MGRFEMRWLNHEIGRAHHRRDVGERAYETHAIAQAMRLNEGSPGSAGVPDVTGHVRARHHEKGVFRLEQSPRLEQIHHALFATQPADEEADDAIGRQSQVPTKRVTLA